MKHIFIQFATICTSMSFIVAIVIPLSIQANTISNSVSVSAHSDGSTESHSVSVVSIVDGEVVENYHESSHKPIEYNKIINQSEDEINKKAEEIVALQALVVKLQQYVELLIKQLATAPTVR